MNQLFPPFDNIKARQGLALIIEQPDYMAGYGTEDWWQTCYSYFVCGSPNGTEVGSASYQHKDLTRAKQLLAVANLRAIGANVDYQLTDFATLVARRVSRNRPDAGGWNLIHTAIGGVALSSPATNFDIDSACENASYFGWPCDAEVERLRSEYMAESEGPGRQARLEALSRAVWASLPAILTGQYHSPYAWRREVTGMLHAANVVFWNVEKAR
jgi:peptide/nickel transport system substrate-binding protein